MQTKCWAKGTSKLDIFLLISDERVVSTAVLTAVFLSPGPSHWAGKWECCSDMAAFRAEIQVPSLVPWSVQIRAGKTACTQVKGGWQSRLGNVRTRSQRKQNAQTANKDEGLSRQGRKDCWGEEQMFDFHAASGLVWIHWVLIATSSKITLLTVISAPGSHGKNSGPRQNSALP